MKKTLLTLIIFTILAQTSLAWGEVAHKYMCEEAVKQVWGEPTIMKCFREKDTEFLQKVCETTGKIISPEYETVCRQLLPTNRGIHPSMIARYIFQDEDKHISHSQCPIKDKSKTMWFCAKPGDGISEEYAQKWFNAMSDAQSECERIYYYCIASHYYTDSLSQLHQVIHIDDKCVTKIEESIDRQLSERGTFDVQAGMYCDFEVGQGSTKKDYRQRLGVRGETINSIINKLVEKGNERKNDPYVKKSNLIIFANSIDHDLATGFYNFLRENKISVQYASSSDFDTLKYKKNIIILGGHKAPEGIGEITSSIISSSNRKKLEEKNAILVTQKKGIYTLNQNIWVIAGYRREDTQIAWQKNKQEILEKLLQSN